MDTFLVFNVLDMQYLPFDLDHDSHHGTQADIDKD